MPVELLGADPRKPSLVASRILPEKGRNLQDNDALMDHDRFAMQIPNHHHTSKIDGFQASPDKIHPGWAGGIGNSSDLVERLTLEPKSEAHPAMPVGRFRTEDINVSAEIVQRVMAAEKRGDLSTVGDQFADNFIFVDHGLGLEFKNRNDLTAFLMKTRELFPDFERQTQIVSSALDVVVSQWTLTATETEPFLNGQLRRVAILAEGASVIRLQNGKITHWSDYYDQVRSRRYRIIPYFTEEVAL
jgi:ketosteroid isomerase-like protein